ncbi:MAG TPA: hypothetical protein VF179_07860, partial [Thermoanaerobaculia bacterium]|nr:hypothetical protein [Thermoanaerobaculia bacterium]
MVFGAADALSPLTEEQALKFFASQDGTSVEDLSPVAAQVAETCGYLPLALAWVGAMVRLRRSGWDDIFARLERVDIVEVKRRFPDHPYPDLLRALEVSVEFLGSARRQRYFELSVFPKGMAIPDAPLLVLWSAAGLEPEEVWDRASDFVARSLAVRDVSGLRLHDFQVDYICERAGDLSLLHARIVDSYAVDCPYGFARGPNDGYFFQRLPYHLARAEREGDLRGLLFDFLWLYAKLEATDVSNLLADFELLPSDPDALKVQGAIRLAGHILSRDPKQFAGQLLGRLVAAGSPDLSRLLEGAKAWNEAPWLRPLVASLTPPDSGLLVILEGHTDSVEAVACLDARRVISASEDRTLRVWDVDTGRVLLVLEGHTDRVRAVLCLDARRAISASDDGTLRIWDAETGETLRTLEGHTNCVIAVARLDDRRVVSGSDDGTLRVWDLDTGQNLLVLGGGGSRVRAVACLDESRIVCSSGYETLHVWDIETGKIVRELMGHAHEVLALARIDERRIISASWDCTLRVWDLESGQTLRKLTERSMVLGVTRLDDRRVVSSSCGKTLQVWDIETGELLRVLKGHVSWVSAVTRLDDYRVISASLDNTLRVWDVERGKS